MTPEASPEELRGRLRALAALVPTLEAPDADFGHWVQPPARDGVITMGWYELGPAGEAFNGPARGSGGPPVVLWQARW